MKAAILVSVAVLLSTTCVLADEKTKAALIEEMLSLTKAEKMMSDVLAQQKDVMHEAMAKSLGADGTRQDAATVRALIQEFEDASFAVLSRALRWENLKPQLASVYADLLTEEELAATVAFYRTPAGQSMMAKMPELMKRSMQIGQKQVEAAMPELQREGEKLQEKLRKAAERQ